MSTQFFKSLNTEAYFDFTTNLIEVNKFSENHADLLLSALYSPLRDTSEWGIDALSTIAHEITHFVDMTASLWGLEFIVRKNLLFNRLYTEEDHDEQLGVYLLNLSETAMHSDLVDEPINSDLLDYETVHSLRYSKVYGVVLTIHFCKAGEIVFSSPLSMLSVIEGNASATEVLLKLKRIAEYPDSFVHERIIERKYTSVVNDSKLSEYNLLLVLIENHFNNFSLQVRLTFLQILIRKVLNLNSITMAQLANTIERSFDNEFLGSAVSMEFRRGLNRHIVVFKLLLFSYSWLDSLEGDAKKEKTELFRLEPESFLEELLQELNVDSEFEEFTPIEFENGLRLYSEIPNVLDNEIITGSSLINFRLTQENKSFTYMNIFDLKLLNISLGDGYVLKMPNPIELDVGRYFDQSLQKFRLLSSSYKNLDIAKFHLDPVIANIIASSRPGK